MIHLNTTAGSARKEAITPAQIAAGKGDPYLFALNDAISQWGAGIYVRPMAEMSNSGNAWSGFTSSGAPKSGHSPADYRKAFARIYLITAALGPALPAWVTGADFHVKWNASGTITSTWWSRVGKLLATIPVTSGETSIAFTQAGS